MSVTLNLSPNSGGSGGGGNLSSLDVEATITTKCNVEASFGSGAISFSSAPIQLSVASTHINAWLPAVHNTDYIRSGAFGTSMIWNVKNSSGNTRPDSFERRYAMPLKVKAGKTMSSVLFESLLSQASSPQAQHTLTLRAGFINTNGTRQQLGQTVLTGTSIKAFTSYVVTGTAITASTDSYLYIEIDWNDGGSTDSSLSALTFSQDAGSSLANFFLS